MKHLPFYLPGDTLASGKRAGRVRWRGGVTVALMFALAGCQSIESSRKSTHGLPNLGTKDPKVPPYIESNFILPSPERASASKPEADSASKTLSEALAAAKGDPALAGKMYSFTAKDLEIKDALAVFARSHELNIVPDPDITGTVTVDFRNLTLEKSMEALLDAFGYFAEINGGLIRVRSIKTESFTVDYIRLVRGGTGASSANVSSSSGSSGSGSGSSTGTSGGGSSASGSGSDVANITINQSDNVKFWEELQEQLRPMLSDAGNLAVNRLAGTIMVTDRKKHVDRVATYLKEVKKTLHRQVDIEARIYEVILNDQFQLGIDWQNVTARVGEYMLSSGGPAAGIPSSRLIVDSPFGGLTPSAPAVSLAVTHKEATAILAALKEQGTLQVVSQPRIRTLNNQSALIKVGVDKPFFRQNVTTITGSGPSNVSTSTEVQTITIGTILSLTPQISEDGWITMDISPIITRLIATANGPGGATAPEVDVKQTSSLVRMRQDNTVVLGGLIQDEQTKTLRKMPILADIPILGRLFTGRFTSARKTELVILITATVVQ